MLYDHYFVYIYNFPLCVLYVQPTSYKRRCAKRTKYDYPNVYNFFGMLSRVTNKKKLKISDETQVNAKRCDC
jgi:hypothetical protein